MQEKKILIQMRDLRVGSGIASCIMKYYEYTVEQGYTIDFLLNRNIDSPFVDTVKKHNSKIYLLPHDTGKPNVSNPQMLLALVIGCVASVWVKMLGWNSFFVLLLSAILFFGSYGLVLLIAHEPLVLEIVTQVIDKAKKVCNK